MRFSKCIDPSLSSVLLRKTGPTLRMTSNARSELSHATSKCIDPSSAGFRERKPALPQDDIQWGETVCNDMHKSTDIPRIRSGCVRQAQHFVVRLTHRTSASTSAALLSSWLDPRKSVATSADGPRMRLN